MTTQDKILPVILSGGSGSRLWPLSRSARPKQFLALAGEESLLQQTLKRLSDPMVFASPLIICNEAHRFQVAEQAEAIGSSLTQIILEPEGRNTAPAAMIAALSAPDPDDLVLLLPSDHHIGNPTAFLEAIAEASAAARAGYLVTFGMKPTAPETGYGYIQAGPALSAPDLSAGSGIRMIERFVEKPSLAVAQEYLTAGSYSWNSGIFLFSAATLIGEMERWASNVAEPSRDALRQSRQQGLFLSLSAEAFSKAENISLDYAVMEKTDKGAVLPCELAWSDLGAWPSLWDFAPRDAAENVLRGDGIAHDSRGCYLHNAGGPLIAACGVEDLVVVSTADAVLVSRRSQSDKVKPLVEELAAEGRSEVEEHREVFRPWGSYTDTDQGEGFRSKRIVVKPGARLSLQRHKHRSEHWVVVKGLARVTVDEDLLDLGVNQSVFIPQGAVHRLENIGEDDLHLIEVQVGDYLGEDDIERLEDNYGRS